MDEQTMKTAYADLFSPSLKKSTNLLVDKAEGAYLFTTDGERYLDMVQGIAVNPLGHSHPAVVEAATAQLKKMSHVSFNLVNYPSALNLAGKLRDVLPFGLNSYFFGNTGAEGVDGSLKLARYVSGRTNIVAFRGSFHGRTMGAASVTSSNVNFRRKYSPLMPQVYFAPYPYCYRCPFKQKIEDCDLTCFEYLKQDMDYVIPASDVSAFLFEPVQGEGGYIVPPKRYVEALGKLAKEIGALLIFDEVQTGICRTGKVLAAEHYDAQPDIVILGKAVGGGFPLAVIASRKEIMDQWLPGTHGSTFGGHPVACAASVATLEIVTKPEFLADVTKKGEAFRARFKEIQAKHPVIGDVRGLGLMNALEIVDAEGKPNGTLAHDLADGLMERHKILALTCGAKGQAIRFIPPLNVEPALLDQVADALEAELKAAGC